MSANFDLKKLLVNHLGGDGVVDFVGSSKNAFRPTIKRPLVFRHYNPERPVKWLGQTVPMSQVINAALPAWHPASTLGTPFSSGSVIPASDRPFLVGADWKVRSEQKVDALCQMATALRIPNITFHAQCDVVDECVDDVLETGRRIEAVTSFWKGALGQYGIKVLWGTANQFSHPDQVQGSASSPSLDVYLLTAIKHKQAFDLTNALCGKLYIIWDGQGGEFDADYFKPEFHEKHLAAMLRKVVAYAELKGIKVAIEPKPFEPSMGQFHRDVSTTLALIQKAGLEGKVGLNPEFDHAKLAGHDIIAEILRAGDSFYTVDINQGDPRVGYDVDRFLRDPVLAVRFWLAVHRVGGFRHGGGCNFDAKPDVKSASLLDLMSGLCMTLDVLAGGLKIAERIIADGAIDDVIASIYDQNSEAEWDSVLGRGITLIDLERMVTGGKKLARLPSLPSDTAHSIIASYVLDGVPE